MTALTTLRKMSVAAAGLLVLLPIASLPAEGQVEIRFSQIDANTATLPPSSCPSAFANIPSLALTLPAKTPTMNYALIFLNVPEPYAKGSDFPGIEFAIDFNSSLVTYGGFTYSIKDPQNPGRMPFTLIGRVNLTSTISHVNAQWRGVRNSTCHIDTVASLSAIIYR